MVLNVLKWFLITGMSTFFMGIQAVAERPMFTDDPTVAPYRALTIEVGNHFDVLRRAERPARYINWFDVNLVYGIARGYELSVHIPAGILLYEPDAPKRSEFGSDDLSVALKRVWHTGDERWGFGLEGRLFFPIESTPVLGSDQEWFWINSMADYATGRWIIRSALGFISPFDTITDGSIIAGIALRTDIHPAHFGFVELYTEAPIRSPEEDFPLLAMVGGGLGICHHAILDFGIPVSVTNTTVFPEVGIYFGITMEL